MVIISGTHFGDYVAQYLAHDKHLINVSFSCHLSEGENTGHGNLMEIMEINEVRDVKT